MSEIVQTSFRFPADLMERLKWECLRRKTNQTAAVTAGLELWLSQGESQHHPVPLEASTSQDAKADSILIEIEKRNPAVGRTLRAAIAAAAVELQIERSDDLPAHDEIRNELDRIAEGVGALTAIAERADTSSGKNRGRAVRKTAG